MEPSLLSEQLQRNCPLSKTGVSSLCPSFLSFSGGCGVTVHPTRTTCHGWVTSSCPWNERHSGRASHGRDTGSLVAGPWCFSLPTRPLTPWETLKSQLHYMFTEFLVKVNTNYSEEEFWPWNILKTKKVYISFNIWHRRDHIWINTLNLQSTFIVVLDLRYDKYLHWQIHNFFCNFFLFLQIIPW